VECEEVVALAMPGDVGNVGAVGTGVVEEENGAGELGRGIGTDGFLPGVLVFGAVVDE